NFIVQHDFGKGFNGQVGYVGNHGVRLIAGQNINATGPGGGRTGTPLYQLWGNSNSISTYTPFNGGNYKSFQSTIKRRIGGAQLGVVYTYSKAINYVDNETSGLRWNWGPMLEANKALAGYDRTHNFQLWTVCSSPFGRGKHWLTQGVAAAILGGWSLS